MIVSEETLLQSKKTRDEVIECLNLLDEIIAEKEKRIAIMDSRLIDKDIIIQQLKQRISELEWQIDSASKIANDGLAS